MIFSGSSKVKRRAKMHMVACEIQVNLELFYDTNLEISFLPHDTFTSILWWDACI